MRVWRFSSPVKVVRAFIEAINARDFTTMNRLMSDDFELVDSSGHLVSGRAACLDIIHRLSDHSPDYHIDVSGISSRGRTVLVSGRAHSEDPRLMRSTQWRAQVQGGKLTRFEAFAAYPAASMADILRHPSVETHN